MNRPKYILRPVNHYFIVFSLVIAILLNMIPLSILPISPDFVALVLLFWNIRQPRVIGMGVSFILGIMMDVHDACLLGEHAFAYTLLIYGAISIRRRMSWVRLSIQVLYVAPLLICVQLIPYIICAIRGFSFPIWHYLINGLSEAALWPIARYILLMPQHRPIDRDDTRPI